MTESIHTRKEVFHNGHPTYLQRHRKCSPHPQPDHTRKACHSRAALRLESGARVLDLGSGSGEMLCTWARDHGVIGTGIDMSQLFTGQAKLRAVELGVADQVKFIHGDAAGYVSDEKVDVAACIGATWIGGGVVGTIELLAATSPPAGSSSWASPTGGSYRRRKMWPRV